MYDVIDFTTRVQRGKILNFGFKMNSATADSSSVQSSLSARRGRRARGIDEE